MDRNAWVRLVLVLLGAGIGAYGVMTDVGPVGWLNAMQQRLFGSYYSLISFAVVMGGVAVVGGALWDGLARFQGKPSDGVLKQLLLGPQAATKAAQLPDGQPITPDRPVAPIQAPPTDAPSTHGKLLFWIAILFSGVTWAIGAGWYWQKTQTVQEDASAIYEPHILTDGTPLPTLKGSHLALRGIPVDELQVVHRTESGSSQREDYRFLPVVGIGWKPEHPVSFILKLDSSHRLPAPDMKPDWAPRNPREIRLFVRRAGAVPQPAIPEFKKMGVPLAADATLISPVATLEGKPTLEDTSTDLFFMKIFCGGITFISVIMSLAVWLRRRYDLKKAGLL
jgi:hypothetical protein